MQCILKIKKIIKNEYGKFLHINAVHWALITDFFNHSSIAHKIT